jgi:tetratricopeptide (TPR) repeat protein
MSDSRPERRLAAILATDVAGYSRLMGSNEEATLARLNTLNEAVIVPAIEEFRGRIVKTMGDGLLAEFASAVDAVRTAVKIQRGTRSFNADVPESEQLRLRIGVNIGDLIYQGSDVFGDGVNACRASPSSTASSSRRPCAIMSAKRRASSSTISALARSRTSSGQADRALPLIEAALRLNPNLADGWGLLGTAENRLGREAESLPHLRQAIRLSPRDPLLGFWLTAITAGEFATGEEAPALDDLKKATAANARFPAPYLWIAAITARQGDLAAAQEALGEYDKREAGMTLARLRQPGTTALRVTDPVLDGLRKAGMREQ